MRTPISLRARSKELTSKKKHARTHTHITTPSRLLLRSQSVSCCCVLIIISQYHYWVIVIIIIIPVYIFFCFCIIFHMPQLNYWLYHMRVFVLSVHIHRDRSIYLQNIAICCWWNCQFVFRFKFLCWKLKILLTNLTLRSIQHTHRKKNWKRRRKKNNNTRCCYLGIYTENVISHTHTHTCILVFLFRIRTLLFSCVFSFLLVPTPLNVCATMKIVKALAIATYKHTNTSAHVYTCCCCSHANILLAIASNMCVVHSKAMLCT